MIPSFLLMASHYHNTRTTAPATMELHRFGNGSSSHADQSPSMQIRRCRHRQYSLRDDEKTEESAERSFQIGTDPIERDWGDSRSSHGRRDRNRNSKSISLLSSNSTNSNRGTFESVIYVFIIQIGVIFHISYCYKIG